MVYDRIYMHAFCYYYDDFASNLSDVFSPKALIKFTLSLRYIKSDFYYIQEHSLVNLPVTKQTQRILQCAVELFFYPKSPLRMLWWKWIRFSLSVHLQNLSFFPSPFFFFPESLQAKMGQLFCNEFLPITVVLFPMIRKQFESKEAKF